MDPEPSIEVHFHGNPQPVSILIKYNIDQETRKRNAKASRFIGNLFVGLNSNTVLIAEFQAENSVLPSAQHVEPLHRASPLNFFWTNK